jgi:hypothetical protein
MAGPRDLLDRSLHMASGSSGSGDRPSLLRSAHSRLAACASLFESHSSSCRQRFLEECEDACGGLLLAGLDRDVSGATNERLATRVRLTPRRAQLAFQQRVKAKKQDLRRSLSELDASVRSAMSSASSIAIVFGGGGGSSDGGSGGDHGDDGGDDDGGDGDDGDDGDGSNRIGSDGSSSSSSDDGGDGGDGGDGDGDGDDDGNDSDETGGGDSEEVAKRFADGDGIERRVRQREGEGTW